MLGPGMRRLLASSLRALSPFVIAVGISWIQVPLVLRLDVLGAHLSGAGFKSWVA